MNVITNDIIWKALADPTRRQILENLASDQPTTTGAIVERFAPSLVRTAVMKHLDVLESAKLIRIERIGRTRHNYLEPRPLEAVSTWLNRRIDGHERNLTRLKKLAESKAKPKARKPK